MNEYDSDRLRQLFAAHGYRHASSYHTADVIVINTCAVRQKAEDKIYSEIGRVKNVKQRNPSLLLCVVGCLAQHYGQQLIDRYPYIDVVLGTKNLFVLPSLIKNNTLRRPIVMNDLAGVDLRYPADPCPADGRISAFVTIMQGCNQYCSYCIVPYVRGHEWSREPTEIVREVSQLVAQGIREVTLLGQNVNAYGKTLPQPCCFSQLLKRLDAIPHLARLRFTTSHPRDLTEDLINCFGYLRTLCEHVHLPLQSGSNNILRRMRRGYTYEDYHEKIKLLRGRIPTIAVTSDIIVGFPGETEADFEQTLHCISEIQFDELFIFHFTPRPGTRAATYTDTIPYAEKIRRLRLVNTLQNTIGLRKNRALIGEEVEVLFEGISKKGCGMIAGKTRTGKVVNCNGPDSLIGSMRQVRIEHATVHSLTGTILNKE